MSCARKTVLGDFNLTAAPNIRIVGRFGHFFMNRRPVMRKSQTHKYEFAYFRLFRWPSPMRLARLERAWA
jgi:hypothetical protein